MAAQLMRCREHYGFSYITVHEPFMEAFAPVIEQLRDRPNNSAPTGATSRYAVARVSHLVVAVVPAAVT